MPAVPSPPVTAETTTVPDRLVVAVDGPSGSGKSSVCRTVATRLQLRYLDTGAMYRAVTWLALNRGMDLRDEPAVAALAREVRLDVATDPANPLVRVNGIDVTSAIRESRISAAVSAVAINLDVRAELVRRQQDLIADPEAVSGIVVEGRDITTVVAPDAPVRILLTASADARVARRAMELHGTVDDRTVAVTSDEVLRRDDEDSSVVEFRRAADGVVVIDTSALKFEDVVDAVLELVVLSGRVNTSGPIMTDEQVASDETTEVAPVLAVVGRPNVGKSTLVNRILGRREAVVEDVPGVTRDRVAYDALWNGRRFTVVDTGGWQRDARGMAAQVTAQAELAVATADAVLLVVDATVGATDTDEAVVRVLRRSGKPVVLAANKVDDVRIEADAVGLWNLGLGEPIAVSALHGRGSGDLLDAVLDALPEAPQERDSADGGPRRVAILGKPNVGKSSLLNRLAGQRARGRRRHRWHDARSRR